MRHLKQSLLAIIFISAGGFFFGASGLAFAGIVAGLMANSNKRGFLVGGFIAALFWLVAAVIKISLGQSTQLLALAGSLANLSGAKTWLLVLASALIAFLAGGLGGWLGGSLRQMMNKPTLRQLASF
jgi:hypothetical protein